MTHLITGANGFLGSYLTRLLVSKGYNVRIMIRKGSDTRLIESIIDKVEVVYGDILDIEAVDAGIKGVDYVYHTAAIISFDTNRTDQMKKTNIEGTSNIVNYCLHHEVKKLVHVSSVAALGDAIHSPISESTEWDEEKTTVYGYSKHYGELEVWRGVAEGLNAAIINPAMIFGAEVWTRGTARIFDEIAKGMPFYTPGGNGMVDVRDVAKAMEVLMMSDVANEKFILVGENFNFQTLFQQIALSTNSKSPTLKAQRWMMNIYVGFEKIKSWITRKEPLVTADSANYSFTTFVYNNHKFKDLFNFSYTPSQQTIKDTAEAYLTSINEKSVYKVLHM
jgi:dihydroflavonol-4-reductase